MTWRRPSASQSRLQNPQTKQGKVVDRTLPGVYYLWHDHPAVRVTHIGIPSFLCMFVGWLTKLAEPEIWVSSTQKLNQTNTWTASNLVALSHVRKMLLQEFN